MTALKGIDQRLRLARLILICGDRQVHGDLESFADAAFAGGVDLLQLREESGSDKERLAALAQVRTAAFRYQGLVAVYDDPELAHDFGADVLHLAEDGPSARKAKRSLHKYARIGRSCHSVDDVGKALEDDDVAYLTIGPVFDGLTFFGHTPGLDLVRHAVEAAPPADPTSKPWFAVGGITIGNLDEVLTAGARRVAVGRAIADAADPGEAARVLKSSLRDAWNADPAMEGYVFGALGSGGPKATFRTSDEAEA